MYGQSCGSFQQTLKGEDIYIRIYIYIISYLLSLFITVKPTVSLMRCVCVLNTDTARRARRRQSHRGLKEGSEVRGQRLAIAARLNSVRFERFWNETDVEGKACGNTRTV